MRDTTRAKEEVKHCKFTLIENGNPMTRRIHEMIVQDAHGMIHRFDGDRLPDSLHVSMGNSQTDHHIAEVLLSPRKLKRVSEPRSDGYRWPVGRDVLHVAIGFAGLQLLRATFFGIDAFLNVLIRAFYEALSH